MGRPQGSIRAWLIERRKRGLPPAQLVEGSLGRWAAGGERCAELAALGAAAALARRPGHGLPAAPTARDGLDGLEQAVPTLGQARRQATGGRAGAGGGEPRAGRARVADRARGRHCAAPRGGAAVGWAESCRRCRATPWRPRTDPHRHAIGRSGSPASRARCPPSCTGLGPSVCACCSRAASARRLATPARRCSGWSGRPATSSPPAPATGPPVAHRA